MIINIVVFGQSILNAAEQNYYTLQKNAVGGYYEMLINAKDPTISPSGGATTITLKISGSPVDNKFGEYLMAAMTQTYAAFTFLNVGKSARIFGICTGHVYTGIRFYSFNSDLRLDLYKDNNDDIVLTIFTSFKNDGLTPNDPQTIKLKSTATAEEIAYFDYAVNTILINKCIFDGVPTITPDPDDYHFKIKLQGDNPTTTP